MCVILDKKGGRVIGRDLGHPSLRIERRKVCCWLTRISVIEAGDDTYYRAIG